MKLIRFTLEKTAREWWLKTGNQLKMSGLAVLETGRLIIFRMLGLSSKWMLRKSSHKLGCLLNMRPILLHLWIKLRLTQLLISMISTSMIQLSSLILKFKDTSHSNFLKCLIMILYSISKLTDLVANTKAQSDKEQESLT